MQEWKLGNVSFLCKQKISQELSTPVLNRMTARIANQSAPVNK